MFILGCMAASMISLASCLKEPAYAMTEGKQITLSVGFEDQVSVESAQEADTKTYLQNEKTIQWGSTNADKVIYVFDTKGAKNAFNATGPLQADGKFVNGPQREFEGNISEDSEISAVIWTGSLATADKSSFENGVFSGSTLKLRATQNVSNAKSFDNLSNIAVMKPGDEVLRNVFGYIKYTVPTVEGGTAGAIKSVTFSADKPLAGKVEIDYTGDVPVAMIVDEAASNSITVNTRVKNNALEAGNLYAVVPVGTYTNFNIKVTLPDDTSFDLPVSDPVVIERGKYTSAGNLPTSDPFASEEPEQPGDETVWPNDPTAFDYGLDNGNSRRAEYPLADREAAGVENKTALTEPALIGDITYGADATYYGNRMTINRVDTEWSTDYPDVIPSKRYMSFKINRPGSVSFFQSLGSGIDRIPTYFLAVVSTVNGVTSAKLVDSVIPTEVTDKRPSSADLSYSEENLKYHVTLTISAEDLEGITEAATVYIYHRCTKGNCQVHYYPLTWTSNGEGSSSVQRKGKFLLAGDSLVTEYGESSAPQTGWGQCLSAALGGGVQVSNHAVGGESTKSFIDSGKWGGLINSTLRGDIVMIQFMHNDQKEAETHATDPATTYRENLKKFIKDAKDRGATPVLVTSVLRRYFHSDGDPQRNLGDYPDAMRAVATETDTPIIDCEQWSYEWLKELGPEGSIPYYVIDKRDPTANDNTHFTKEGAEIVAKFIADEIIRLGIWSK